VLDWSTHQRHAQGSDNFQLTWADDDHQYGWWGDGGGFGGTNTDGRVSLGFARIEGDGNNYRGYNVWGGKNAENPEKFNGKSWGTICVKGVLYSWIVPDVPDTGGPRDHYRYIELAKSTDCGATWAKADWRWTGEDNLIIPTFLNFGKNNAGARDEFVYSYFIRPQYPGVRERGGDGYGLNVHKPGALFLARVHQGRIFESRDAYEWFTGMDGDAPTWGTLKEKQPVFENPDGTGWCLSASYNPGLGRYLLATEHTKSHAGIMGLFDAPEPWGPWTTVEYWTADNRFGAQRPGSDLDWRDNLFFFSFAPKWWSEDGREFTLVFTGGGSGRDNDSFNAMRGRFSLRSPVAGPLRVHSENPRYFTDGSSKVVYLTGFQYWDVVREDGSPGPDAMDFTEFLDIAERYGTNFVRLWRWNELAKFRYSRDGEAFQSSPCPWMRTGPGTALDGKPKFELTRFDPAYFDRLRSRVMAAGKRGFYVAVMLFEGHSLQFSDLPWRWDGHPFHKDNNINGLDGDPDGSGRAIRLHTLELPAVTAVQEAYVRRVIDTVNDLDNVLYEITNESHPGSAEWQYHMIRFIKAYQADKPKQHPVWMSSHQGGPSNAVLFDSPADCIAPTPEGGYRDNPPAADGRKVILSDTDHLWGAPGDRVWVWKTFLRGLNPINYMELTQLVDPSPRLEQARRAMGDTRRWAGRMNLAAMTPRNDLASTGYCLAHPGREYLVYQPKAGEALTVELNAGKYRYEWFNPAQGKTVGTGEIETPGRSRQFKPPFDGDAVLYLKALP